MNDTEARPDPPESSPADSPGTHGSASEGVAQKSSETPCGECDAGDVERSNDTHAQPREIGGRKGPDPVRYGDWEKNGRCIDF